MMEGIDKLRAVRIEKMDELVSAGTNPYPYRYRITHHAADVVENDASLTESETVVTVAGRIMALRKMGKASFAHIMDQTGRIQIYIKQD